MIHSYLDLKKKSSYGSNFKIEYKIAYYCYYFFAAGTIKITVSWKNNFAFDLVFLEKYVWK